MTTASRAVFNSRNGHSQLASIAKQYGMITTYRYENGHRVQLAFPYNGDLPYVTIELLENLEKIPKVRHRRGDCEREYRNCSLEINLEDKEKLFRIGFGITDHLSSGDINKTFYIKVYASTYEGERVIVVDSPVEVVDDEETSKILDMVASLYGYKTPA